MSKPYYNEAGQFCAQQLFRVDSVVNDVAKLVATCQDNDSAIYVPVQQFPAELQAHLAKNKFPYRFFAMGHYQATCAEDLQLTDYKYHEQTDCGDERD